MTQHYVLVFVECKDNVLYIKKQKPEAQKGRYNLPGGKVEAGETNEQAAIRELKEETGLNTASIIKRGEIIGKDYVIHCFNSTIEIPHCCENNHRLPKLKQPDANEPEQVFWSNWDTIKDDCNLMSNLRIIVPLISKDVWGWSLEEIECESSCHKALISF